MVEFTGTPTLTHHATNLVLPTAANIVVEAGDTAIFARRGTAGTQQWQCTHYQRKSGKALKEDFTITTGTSGKIIIGSLQVIWGETPANNAQGGVVQAFHTAFGGTPYMVMLTPLGNSAPTYQGQTTRASWSATNFTVYQSFAAACGYFAIGPKP